MRPIYLIILVVLVSPAFCQDSLGVRQIGSIHNFWHYAADCVIEGNYGYIAGGESGLWIVDLNDAGGIHGEIGHYGAEGYAKAIEVADNCAYVIFENFGLRIYDVSDPQNPYEISSLKLPGALIEMSISQNLIFIASGERGLRVVDVSDPYNPFECEHDNRSRFINTISAGEDFLAVPDVGRIRLYRITEDNSLIATSIIECHAPLITVQNDFIYTANLRRIMVFDISDLENPQLAQTFEIEDNIYKMLVKDNYLICLTREYALEIIEISDIDNIFIEGSLRLNGLYLNIDFDYDYCLLADRVNGLLVVEINDHQDPAFIGRYGSETHIAGIDGSEGQLWTLLANGALERYDMAEPDQPALVDLYEFDFTPVNFFCNGNLLFICDTLENIHVYVTNGEGELIQRVTWEEFGSPVDLEIQSNFLILSFPDRFEIFQISNIENPQEIHPNYELNVTGFNPCVYDEFLYVCEYIDGERDRRFYLSIYDLRNPDDVSKISHIRIPQDIAQFEINCENGILFTQSYWYLSTYDISQPISPEILDAYKIRSGVTSLLFLSRNYIYYSQYYSNHLATIFNIHNPSDIHVAGYYQSAERRIFSCLIGNTMILGDEQSLSIFDCSGALDVEDINSRELADQFGIVEAFPNPFNDLIRIRVNSPAPDCYSLALYDLNGRIVKAIWDDAKIAAGEHTVEWRPEGVGAGIYFLIFQNEYSTQSQKIVFLP